MWSWPWVRRCARLFSWSAWTLGPTAGPSYRRRWTASAASCPGTCTTSAARCADKLRRPLCSGCSVQAADDDGCVCHCSRLQPTADTHCTRTDGQTQVGGPSTDTTAWGRDTRTTPSHTGRRYRSLCHKPFRRNNRTIESLESVKNNIMRCLKRISKKHLFIHPGPFYISLLTHAQ